MEPMLHLPRRTVSVLIPAYNEAPTIATVLRRVLDLQPLVGEVIVVDDGSTDGTGELAERFARHSPLVKVHRFERNRGKSAAIRRALEDVTGEVVIIQDADLEYDPAEIPEVVAPILRGDADVVYGSRFMVRRAARVLYFYHFLANKLLTFLSNLLTNRNMSDIETCYKGFRAGVIKPLALSSKGFGLEVEITAMICKTSARTYEVPISYYGRTYEEGKKIGLWDGLAAVGYILYYNVVAPWRHTGRRYRQAVEGYLADLRSKVPPGGPIAPRPVSSPLGDWPVVVETTLATAMDSLAAALDDHALVQRT
jgi:glycosyltransferase involved in cell wall biosynthesis